MRLQVSTKYALIAVLELTARPDLPVSAAEIALKHNLPLSHLAKVLRELGRSGIAQAMRGLGGGYQLTDSPKHLTLLEVISVFEPISENIFGENCADPLGKVFEEISTVQNDILSSTTFYTLMRLADNARDIDISDSLDS